MPLERKICEECRTNHQVCPECQQPAVSVDTIKTEEYPPGQGHLSPDFVEFGKFAEDGDELKYAIACWNCDYREKRKISLEVL